ncbi:hypothetical protein IMZ48_46470 [Candidatus Bathyarchaeota archaeon]|nr:hypothetical protein [Candidatus Bathyarchaeota archaeon]
MAYLAPIHKPTSVRHALSVQLSEEGVKNLVLAYVSHHFCASPSLMASLC